jgi:hypothetical protein
MTQTMTQEELDDFHAREKRKNEMYRFFVIDEQVHVHYQGKTVASAPIAELVRIAHQTSGEVWDEMTERNERHHFQSDRGLSLPEWQKWLVGEIIYNHGRGLADDVLVDAFAEEIERRFGTPPDSQITPTLELINFVHRGDTVQMWVKLGAQVAMLTVPYEDFQSVAAHMESGKTFPYQLPRRSTAKG